MCFHVITALIGRAKSALFRTGQHSPVMNSEPTQQERMDAAFENYLELSEVLREDMLALHAAELDSQHWRRNYVRLSAVLIEGYASCFREMCVVSLECEAPVISQKEREVLLSERSFNANERIKLTLRAAYKLFEIRPAPNFEGPEWVRAKRILEKRHLLMHPKTAEDLMISDVLWNELRDGAIWLIEQFFAVIAALQTKHCG
jgi:hypothetical protein